MKAMQLMDQAGASVNIYFIFEKKRGLTPLDARFVLFISLLNLLCL